MKIAAPATAFHAVNCGRTLSTMFLALPHPNFPTGSQNHKKRKLHKVGILPKMTEQKHSNTLAASVRTKSEMETEVKSTSKSIAVIGAGVAGVAVATAFHENGIFDFVVYESKNRVGGLWVENYPNARVQTAFDLFEYPDHKYSATIRKRMDPPAPTAREVCDYVEEYVDKKGIRGYFQFETKIRSVVKQDDGMFALHMPDGSVELYKHVIVCSGSVSESPNKIDIPGLDLFQQAGGVVLHTSERKSVEDEFRNKRVPVIGNGKSAVDAAMDAAKVGSAPPIQAYRRMIWFMPRYLLGFIQYKWAFHSRWGASLFPRYYSNDSFLCVLVHFLTTPLKWILWRIAELVLLAQLRIPYRCWPPMGTVESKTALDVSALVTDAKHLNMIRSGGIDMRQTTVAKLAPGKAILANGDEADIDVLVMGTGWNLGFQYLDEASIRSKIDTQDDGMWLYRNMLPANDSDLHGLIFVGATALTFSNIFTSYIQAQWCARLVKGTIKWPSQKDMEDTVERERAFRRKYYPKSKMRGSSIKAYMQHYHDVLFTDMGMDPRSAFSGCTRPIANLIMPLTPETMGRVFERAKESTKPVKSMKTTVDDSSEDTPDNKV